MQKIGFSCIFLCLGFRYIFFSTLKTPYHKNMVGRKIHFCGTGIGPGIGFGFGFGIGFGLGDGIGRGQVI